MPETLQQLKVRTAREIRQRTAARIARLRAEEESSDEDSDKHEKKERKVVVVQITVLSLFGCFASSICSIPNNCF